MGRDVRWVGPLDDDSLGGFIAGDSRPGVAAVAIATMDGRAAIGGTSGGLGNPADAALLQAMRRRADVVLVGAGTVRAEDYGPAPAPTRLAVVSRSLEVGGRIFGDPGNPPLVLAGPGADRRKARAIERRGGEVAVLPGTSPADILGELARRGLHRVALEGGPSLYARFLADDAVDEVFLTLAPTWLGAGPVTLGDRDGGNGGAVPRGFALEAVAHSDSHLFLRYSRARAG